MDELIKALHDIEGVDSVGYWPLALGWWVVVAAVLGAVAAIGLWCAKNCAFRKSWKYDARLLLKQLESHLDDMGMQQAAALLSEYVRRIAIHRFSRKDCAGLTGDAWLDWLSKHDPQHFDWRRKGRFIIDAPYAPEDKRRLTSKEIKEVIHAVTEWVKS